MIAGAGALFLFLAIFLLFPFLLVACFVFWVITLVHVIQHEDVPDRIVWIILHFVGLGIIAGPIYFFAIKQPYDKKHAKKQKA